MNLRQVLLEGTRLLRDAGIEGPERDARLLLADVLSLDVGRISLEPDLGVSAIDAAQFRELTKRRASHEPVSRILGYREFWGRRFEISPDVLDPRPDTETLIALALETSDPKTVLDLGCGSGIIAITLLSEISSLRGVATDISAECLELTLKNAKTHEVTDRLKVKSSNWFSDVEGTFDLIVSNPPYISEAEMETLSPDVFRYDPHLALTPGGDGTAPYSEIAKGAAQHLNKNGRVLVEIGWKQGEDVMRIFEDAGFSNVACHKDLNGHDRVVSAHHT